VTISDLIDGDFLAYGLSALGGEFYDEGHGMMVDVLPVTMRTLQGEKVDNLRVWARQRLEHGSLPPFEVVITTYPGRPSNSMEVRLYDCDLVSYTRGFDPDFVEELVFQPRGIGGYSVTPLSPPDDVFAGSIELLAAGASPQAQTVTGGALGQGDLEPAVKLLQLLGISEGEGRPLLGMWEWINAWTGAPPPMPTTPRVRTDVRIVMNPGTPDEEATDFEECVPASVYYFNPLNDFFLPDLVVAPDGIWYPED
jgi:hypothetical protein